MIKDAADAKKLVNAYKGMVYIQNFLMQIETKARTGAQVIFIEASGFNVLSKDALESLGFKVTQVTERNELHNSNDIVGYNISW